MGVALGSRLAAELYDCRVLAEDVEDHPRQRDALRLAGAASQIAGGAVAQTAADAKTSIVFWGGGDESPGWLVAILQRALRAGA